MFKKLAVVCAFATSLSFYAGCHFGADPGCTDQCSAGEVAIYCSIGLQTTVMCGVDQTTAALSCDAAGGAWSPATVCSAGGEDDGGTGDETDGSSHLEPWNPGRNVTLDTETGELVIDAIFLEDVKADPSPLAWDSTVLRPVESGHYEVAVIGELADALGWELGDVLLSVDGYEIDGLSAFVTAYSDLADNSGFKLRVIRSGREVVLRYRVE